ncbi:MAG: glycine-rich domain-containing protein [Bacteroidota bacterium]
MISFTNKFTFSFAESAKTRRLILFASISLLVLINIKVVKSQTIERITTRGNFTFTVPTYSGPDLSPGDEVLVDLEVIIVGAGGGGGRGNGAGGGGGGEVRSLRIEALEGAELTGYIGQGGAGRSGSNGSGGHGESTIFHGETAIGGRGGGGGNAGPGGNSGAGTARGIANSSGTRRAGGGGGGAVGNGNNGATGFPPPFARGGDGGAGINGYGGGGGGAASGGAGSNNIVGQGRDGGTSGSTGNASNASNGGGGGGGINRGGNGGDGVVEISISFRILPVEFLYLRAELEPKDRITKIEWATAKEWENSHFEIERAQNGIENWEKIGAINSVGYSDQMTSYSFLDEKLPITGGRIFYRLRSVNLDDKYTYSKTLAIQVAPVSGNSTWRLYPNPSEAGTYVHLVQLGNHIGQDQAIAFKISDSSGISAGDFIANSLEQVESQLNEYLKNQKAGLYFLHLSSEAYSENIKIFVR